MTPTIVTSATPTATLGQPISDVATVTVPANAPAATGTVTFNVFGPDDATCAGAGGFTSTVPLTGGATGATATSAPFTPHGARHLPVGGDLQRRRQLRAGHERL